MNLYFWLLGGPAIDRLNSLELSRGHCVWLSTRAPVSSLPRPLPVSCTCLSHSLMIPPGSRGHPCHQLSG